jgi:glucokinase
MSLTLAVDIGGTHIRAAIYEPDSTKPLAHQRSRFHANKSGVYDRLVQAIESGRQKDKLTAIGIVSPGPLDPYTGIILVMTNTPEWQNFPLALARMKVE